MSRDLHHPSMYAAPEPPEGLGPKACRVVVLTILGAGAGAVVALAGASATLACLISAGVTASALVAAGEGG